MFDLVARSFAPIHERVINLRIILMEIFKRDSKFHPLNVDFSSHDARYPIIGFLKREDFQIAEFSLTYSQIYLGSREIFFPKFKDDNRDDIVIFLQRGHLEFLI